MKKHFVFIVFVLCTSIFLSACNANAKPLSVNFSDITMGGNEYTIKVVYAEEKLYEDVYTDILISSPDAPIEIKIRKEFELEFTTIVIANKDFYYSLTALIAKANGKSGQEVYTKYKQQVSTTYIFNAIKDCTIKFKAVTGTAEGNSTGGQLLTNKVDASSEFSVKMKKKT